MNQPYAIPIVDTEYIDRFLLNCKRQYNVPGARSLKAFEHSHLQVWCHRRARYNLPTTELVEAVKGLIDSRSAIEIGAGMGDFGRALGIPMTDSHQQTLPEMQLYYAVAGQPAIHPPSDVEKLDAVGAVTKYKPRVVVASWVTQLYQDGDAPRKIGSSIYGVDEHWVLDHCETYIFVGNTGVHKDKRILTRPHQETRPYYLVSRGRDQAANVLWVWNRP
jgi:hypothetical protein